MCFVSIATDMSTSVAKLCAKNADSVNALVSTLDAFYVKFVSDDSVAYKGWRMLIFANDTGTKHQIYVAR